MAAQDDARAIVELMVLTAWADGKVEGSEALAVHKIVAANPLLRTVGSTAELSKQARARLAEVGLEDALREASLRLTDLLQRELAFRSCAKVMGADATFDGEEALVLSVLQETFGFSNDDVKRLLVLSTQD